MKKSKTILIIDDDVWFAEQISRVIRAAGYKTKHAPDGLAAIELIDKSLPDMIILDMFLPGPNALVLLHEMQSYSDLAALPVVVCTSSAADIPSNGLSVYGVRQVLDKASMQPQDVVAAVKRVFL